MTTPEIFRNLNGDLLLQLMESQEPTEADSFSDLNDDVINYSLKEHGLCN